MGAKLSLKPRQLLIVGNHLADGWSFSLVDSDKEKWVLSQLPLGSADKWSLPGSSVSHC